MDGGAKHARDSGNPHAPGAQAGLWATSPHFLWARGEGEGIFIISDINNSANGVKIRHLEMNHSGQHRALAWARLISRWRGYLQSARRALRT